MTKPVTNHAASVRDRLLHDSRRRSANFQLVLQRYAAERFLYRLGASPHRERFVLKGAMLFVLWDQALYRTTRDLDLAGYWTNDAASLLVTFRDICEIACVEDGITLVAETLRAQPIRNKEEYHGFRLKLQARLASAVIPLQVDVGFGDAIVPPAEDAEYPVLLDAPPPHVRVYPREVAIAEKLHAMVTHGLENSRFKDFYDVFVLANRFAFSGERLVAAITATFSRRASAPSTGQPVALTTAFYTDVQRAAGWRHYLAQAGNSGAPADFAAVGEIVRVFLGRPWNSLATSDAFIDTWPSGGPWPSATGSEDLRT